MLRARPTLLTTDTEQMASLFRALGLLRAEGNADQSLFDAGGGRIALREAAEGLGVIGFEAGDLTVFARRTRESGTAAEMVEPDGVTVVLVTTPRIRIHCPSG
ncbi:hypothetical protein [Arthrobacter sp. TMN-50]